MGEKVTPPAASTEVLRAKALRDARKRGTPPVLTQVSEAPSNGHSAANSLDVEKAYLEQIVENAPEAISILDLDLRILRINGEFTRLFGFTAEEAYERVIDALIAAGPLRGNGLDRRKRPQRKQAFARNPPPQKRWNPGGRAALCLTRDCRRTQGCDLRFLSRYYRAKARRRAELRALRDRRARTLGRRSAAVLCRHS